MLLDKGFQLTSNSDADAPVFIQEVVNERGWKMGERELFLTTLVINGLFDLPDIENDDFLTLCEDVNAKRIQDVLKVVTVLGTKWSLLRQGTRYCQREFLTQKENISSSNLGTRLAESNLRILLHLEELSEERMVRDALKIPLGPITRAKAKKMKESFIGLIQHLLAEPNPFSNYLAPVKDPGGDQGLVRASSRN
ncbi:hypothetical protein GOBAR_DD14335 [Gossypium barbadense]|nr:hypothetical protein GOBAR_DD14335 [Gossypium barbadense]